MAIGEAIGLKYGDPTRDAFGKTLLEIGRQNQNLVVIDGDVGNSTRTEFFGKEFPGRFFNVGIAEQSGGCRQWDGSGWQGCVGGQLCHLSHVQCL
jgi:transketolase